MNSVALIQLPHFYGQDASRPQENYPLGLGYISAFLKTHGIEHTGVDLWGLQYSAKQALTSIDFSSYDVLAISAYSTQYKYLKEFSLGLKARYPDKPIVCGGPGPTFSDKTILDNTGVDICVLGEGEITLFELLGKLDRLEDVKGISYLEKGNIHRTPLREYIKDLDILPFPNREFFDFERIIDTNNEVRAAADGPDLSGKSRRVGNIIAGRGCPYRCAFCSKTFQGTRLRSVASIMSEIEEMRQRYRITHVSFDDELVLVGKKRTLELCAAMAQTGLTWSCQGRINQVDREILSTMKQAGCNAVGYGVESISQTILDAMKKDIKAEDILPVIQMTREIGIKPIIQYMYGYPGENDQTIKATVEFFKQIDHPFVGFMTTPIPGTALYQECLSRGLIRNEEEYLLCLDSGYNTIGTLINMTDFSDQELVKKWRRLQFNVMHNYLKSRPAEYARFIVQFAKRALIRIVK